MHFKAVPLSASAQLKVGGLAKMIYYLLWDYFDLNQMWDRILFVCPGNNGLFMFLMCV